MTISRFSSVMVVEIILNCLLNSAAFAGFGFGGNEGKSGLDFNNGYDVNTVMNVSGRVTSATRAVQNEHVFVEIKANGEIINLNIGPKSSWDKKEIPLHLNDEITAKGSRAQGKDGKTYLLVQKLTNRTNGASIVVRNERGEPAWSGQNAPSGGMQRGGGMMRGSGGMMRH